MDFELEMACVIGRRCRDVSRDEAHACIFGYTIFNDLSARDAQMLEMPAMLGPCKGKDFDDANVMGPVITTADEIGDPYDLYMRARVNGDTWCDASSSTMNITFADMIVHISRGETLHPGEVIGSGTVGGGCGMELGRFLESGDIVELEIEKIGVLRTRVLRAENQREDNTS
jgi:2-keto-4-pentenoate hydratase/2-oxohepta-3-ene-1,7-dioic acid hydratase in catechol pathway